MSLENQESGRVIAVEASAIWVETIQRSTCQACSQKSGCGSYSLSKFMPNKRNQIKVSLGEFASSDFQVGDFVQIAIGEGVVLKSAFIVYMLPIVAMIVGAGVGNHLSRSDLMAVLGGLLGLGVGFIAVKWHSLQNAHNPALQPRLVGVEDPTNCYVPLKITELSD